MGLSFLKKITTAGVGLGTEVLEGTVKGNGDSYTEVMRVYGMVSASEAGKDTGLGPYSVFTGEFEAVNMLNGEKFRATKLILPAIAEAPLLSLCDDAHGKSKVRFALAITVNENKSAKGGRKYRFGVTPLMEMSAEDELSKLGASLPKTLTDQTTKKRR